MPYLSELRKRAQDCGIDDVSDRLDSILESVIYSSALPAYARHEIDNIWEEVEGEEERFNTPPDHSELLAHHPYMFYNDTSRIKTLFLHTKRANGRKKSRQENR